MEIFSFVEQSFDINLINKCKSQLGSKSTKKINTYLRDLCKSDIASNNFQVTVINEVKEEKIQRFSGENKDNLKILDNCEKENIISGAESDLLD